VLSGAPQSASLDKLEYRFFKRDTLTPAVAEVNSVTDIEIELIEHKEGRAIAEIQFGIKPKVQTQASLPLTTPPDPVDLTLVKRAVDAGIDAERAEEMLTRVGSGEFEAGLRSLEERVAKNFPSPVRDKARYLRTILATPQTPVTASQRADEAEQQTSPASPTSDASKREAKWREEWLRRRREEVIGRIAALPAGEQQSLVEELQAEMQARGTHPSITKRLLTSGWQHPMVLQEMVRFYASKALGAAWDVVSPHELLSLAAELGDA